MNSPDRPVAYLDHAATTPIYPEVIDAMAAQLGRLGNASSLHGSGRDARRVVEESRETIAACTRRPPLRGRVHLRRHRVRQPRAQGVRTGPVAAWTTGACASCRPRSSTTPCSTRCTGSPPTKRAEVELLPVDSDGLLDLTALRGVDRARPRSPSSLITVMWANNEVGTIQPIDDVVALASPHGIPVHTDAVQALGQVPLDFAASGVDAMTVTGHKIGGPFGVGVLLLRREVELVSAAARRRAGARRALGHDRRPRHRRLRPARPSWRSRVSPSAPPSSPPCATTSCAGSVEVVPDAQLNGATGDGQRLPGNAHLSFPGCEGDSLLMLLDAQGHRVLHRVGVLGRRTPGLPRPARDGTRRRHRAGIAAVLARAHVDTGPTSTG